MKASVTVVLNGSSHQIDIDLGILLGVSFGAGLSFVELVPVVLVHEISGRKGTKGMKRCRDVSNTTPKETR